MKATAARWQKQAAHVLHVRDESKGRKRIDSKVNIVDVRKVVVSSKSVFLVLKKSSNLETSTNHPKLIMIGFLVSVRQKNTKAHAMLSIMIL